MAVTWAVRLYIYHCNIMIYKQYFKEVTTFVLNILCAGQL